MAVVEGQAAGSVRKQKAAQHPIHCVWLPVLFFQIYLSKESKLWLHAFIEPLLTSHLANYTHSYWGGQVPNSSIGAADKVKRLAKGHIEDIWKRVEHFLSNSPSKFSVYFEYVKKITISKWKKKTKNSFLIVNKCRIQLGVILS